MSTLALHTRRTAVAHADLGTRSRRRARPRLELQGVGVPLLNHHLTVAKLRVPVVRALVFDRDAKRPLLDLGRAVCRCRKRGDPGDADVVVEGAGLQQVTARRAHTGARGLTADGDGHGSARWCTLPRTPRTPARPRDATCLFSSAASELDFVQPHIERLPA